MFILYYTVRVSDGFLIRNSAAHNNEPQMGNRGRDSETLRSTCNITSRTSPQFVFTLLLSSSQLSFRRGRRDIRCLWGGGRRARKLIRFKIMIMKTSAARRMSLNTLRAHVSGDNTPYCSPISGAIQKRFHPK